MRTGKVIIAKNLKEIIEKIKVKNLKKWIIEENSEIGFLMAVEILD